VSPRTADPAIREALVEVAARLIASHEPLTTRRLASEVGTSTMAVYTHFGGLDQVRRAVRVAGFERLRAHLSRVERTDDPAADVAVLGWGYCVNAIRNPTLYRVMFMEVPLDEADEAVGLDTFEQLVNGIQRCIDAGRFRPADAWELATYMWANVHGATALHLAGLLDEPGVLRAAMAGARAFMVDFGDSPDAVDRALQTAVDRVAGSDWESGVDPAGADASRRL
jgi:AcrR family transcriptional regulator